MNLYIMHQSVKSGGEDYETFLVSCVVAAESEDAAKKLSWCAPEDVQLDRIGIAREGTKEGIIFSPADDQETW